MTTYQSFARRKSTGFSLLELIIVLVIIGVLVAAVTLSISDNRGDNLRLEARRLAARISLARDEAILTNQEFGLEITKEGYQFLVLTDERWQVVESFGERQLIQQKIPENMVIQLEVEGLYAQFQNQDNGNSLFKDYDERDTNADNTDDKENNEPVFESQEEADAAKKVRPQIYLMTSGEVNPFVLLIGYDDNEPIYYQLKANIEGQVNLEGPIKEPFTFAEIKTP